MTDQTKITFQSDGSPYSNQFDDIYFDTTQGTRQSECVFIDGNNLKTRLETFHGNFVIAETGFGTGLNFLLILRLLSQLEAPLNSSKTLQFISVEKYPLSKQQLIASLKILPELASFAHSLIEQYPDHPDGSAQLSFFDGYVSLQLLFHDATEGFAQLNSQHRGKSPALVDAWFLDGFSPAKNPEMWHEGLFKQITRLSKEQATLATFTVSGKVKRQLITAGFRIEKRAAEGKKEQMMLARFQHNPHSGKGYQQRPLIPKPQHVSIIGGGIASACAAYALTQQGVKVTVYCQDFTLAQGASSNNIGALYPLIHQQKDEISEFYQLAFKHAITCYKAIEQQGHSYDHDWCGLLEISYKPALALRQKNIEQSNIWPKSLIHGVNQEQASKIAGIPLPFGGLFIPDAGWIAPKQLVQQVFKAAEKTNRLRIETGCKITSITQTKEQTWQLHSDTQSFPASIVIYCGGAEGINLEINKSLPLTPVRGQVTSMKSNSHLEKLSTVICHKGYLTPKNKELHCIGATFDKNTYDVQVRAEDDQYNLNMLEKCLPKLVDWQANDIISSKARLRCATPDHMPIVGPMPDIAAHKAMYSHLSKDKRWRYDSPAPVIKNLYCLTGLGARGLCTAPLLADILTSDICGTPYSLSNEKLFNLAPNRFVIRDIIRQKDS